MFGTHDAPSFMQMLKELEQWVFTTRQGAPDVPAVVWALQNMEQAARGLEEQLLKLSPNLGSLGGGDPRLAGYGLEAQHEVECFGQGTQGLGNPLSLLVPRLPAPAPESPSC